MDILTIDQNSQGHSLTTGTNLWQLAVPASLFEIVQIPLCLQILWCMSVYQCMNTSNTQRPCLSWTQGTVFRVLIYARNGDQAVQQNPWMLSWRLLFFMGNTLKSWKSRDNNVFWYHHRYMGLAVSTEMDVHCNQWAMLCSRPITDSGKIQIWNNSPVPQVEEANLSNGNGLRTYITQINQQGEYDSPAVRMISTLHSLQISSVMCEPGSSHTMAVCL